MANLRRALASGALPVKTGDIFDAGPAGARSSRQSNPAAPSRGSSDGNPRSPSKATPPERANPVPRRCQPRGIHRRSLTSREHYGPYDFS
jgi:hypothetical protein